MPRLFLACYVLRRCSAIVARGQGGAVGHEIIERARRNLLSLRAELARAKEDIDHEVDLDQLLVGVEIVKADALIAQAELLAAIADRLFDGRRAIDVLGHAPPVPTADDLPDPRRGQARK